MRKWLAEEEKLPDSYVDEVLAWLDAAVENRLEELWEERQPIAEANTRRYNWRPARDVVCDCPEEDESCADQNSNDGQAFSGFRNVSTFVIHEGLSLQKASDASGLLNRWTAATESFACVVGDVPTVAVPLDQFSHLTANNFRMVERYLKLPAPADAATSATLPPLAPK